MKLKRVQGLYPAGRLKYFLTYAFLSPLVAFCSSVRAEKGTRLLPGKLTNR
jgi:hypothetical protein